MFREHSARLFVVTYRTADDLVAERQHMLLLALERAAHRGKTGVVFIVPEVERVSADVRTFWMAALDRAELRIASFAVVTKSIAVRIAAGAFDVQNKWRGKPFRISSFESEEMAIKWVGEALS